MMILKNRNLNQKRRLTGFMDRYDLANEISMHVKNSKEPLEDCKYLARVLSVLYDMSQSEEEIEFKKKILKITN